MVKTRTSDKSDTLQELPASGKLQPEPQQRPAKRPKTAKPLQEADEEIERAIEATYAKEAEQLTQEDEEMATKQAEKAMGDEPEYRPSREEEAEDEAEERDAEEEMESAVPAEEALQEKGELEGAAGLEDEQTIDTQGKAVSPEEAEEGEEEATTGKQKQQQQGGSMTTGIDIGQIAPDFTLKDQDGNDVSLKAFRGKIVALYFYNKDDTAVVSKGGQAFNALVPEMKKLGGELLFIGPDSVSSHKKFKEKAKLNFPLLSDSKKEVAKTFRCIRGRNVTRCTVLLDPMGAILKIWKDIPEEQVETNPGEALEWLKGHMPSMQQQMMA